MKIDSQILVDVFRDVVKYVQEDWDVDNCEAPYFEHGHPLQILQMLTDKDKSSQFKYKKYPLIVLLQDFQENKGENPMFTMRTSPRVLILDSTERNFDPGQRYDQVFRPVLYPIYNLLLESMADSGFFNFSTPDQITHNKWDRLFWGREGLYRSEKNVFNDYLDGIDITFIDLQVNNKSVC